MVYVSKRTLYSFQNPDCRSCGNSVLVVHDFTLTGLGFLFQIVGLAVTGLGAYILVLKNKVVHDPIDFLFDPSTLMCTVGSITVVITFFGWMGALREYTSFLRAVIV